MMSLNVAAVGVNFILRSTSTSLGFFVSQETADYLLKQFVDGSLPEILHNRNVMTVEGTAPFAFKSSELIAIHVFNPNQIPQSQQPQQPPTAPTPALSRTFSPLAK